MADSGLKKLELAIRGWYNGRVGKRSEPYVITGPVQLQNFMTVKKVLLLRQDRIGDVIVSTPIIRALREILPTAEMDMVLSTNNVAVRRAVEPYVSHIHVFRKSVLHLFKLRMQLRRRGYDLVIDLMDNPSSTSALLISGAQPRLSLGIDKLNRGVYTHVVPLADQSRVHIVERIARLLWAFDVSLPTSALRPIFPLTETERQDGRTSLNVASNARVLGINISGSDVHRMYPVEKMSLVVQQIKQYRDRHASLSDVDLRILSAPQHTEMALAIGKTCGVDVVPASASYSAFAASISACDMVLTPDTSAVHVTAAFCVPSVVLFSLDARGLMPWYPYDTPCWPCYTSSGALEDIDVSEVVTAAVEMMHACTESKVDPA